MSTLEDIRVGDIMLCPDGVERRVEQCNGDMVHAGDDIWYRRLSLRNPEFRVGDKVRWRGFAYEIRTWGQVGQAHAHSREYALVERAPVVEKKPDGVRVMENRAGPWKMNHEGSHVRDDGTALYRAIVSRVGDRWEGLVSGAGRVLMSNRDNAMAWCDARLRDDGWVLEDQPVPPLWKPAPPSCPFCNHPGEKHYAGCISRDPMETELHTGSEGLMHHAVSRIQHLGWDQPAPIVVLCQNEEDVP